MAGTRTPEIEMPSDRKQLNIRLDPELEALVALLIPAISEAIGLKVSQSDLFRLGALELKKKYLPPEEPIKGKGGKK